MGPQEWLIVLIPLLFSVLNLYFFWISIDIYFDVFISLKDFAEKVNFIDEDEIWNIVFDLTMVCFHSLADIIFKVRNILILETTTL